MDGIATTEPGRARARSDLRALIGDRLHPLVAIVPQFSRYTVVSVLALALDFAVYLMLTTTDMKAALAGVIGYGCGLALHYLLSVRFVFDAHAAQKAQVRLFGEFALSGLAGMAITALVIALVADVAGLPVLPAKILAAGASFLVVFALRRSVVFARRDAPPASP